jgi:hypothetical protein
MENRPNEQNVSAWSYGGSVMDCADAMSAEGLLHLQGYFRKSWPIEFCDYLQSYFTSLLHGLLTKLLLDL